MNIWCIIVCYNPDTGRLRHLVQMAAASGAKIVLVDNSEQSCLASTLNEDCEIIALGYNSGIAHAQNLGIALALQNNADVIGFFDQDSHIDDGLVKGLANELCDHWRRGSCAVVAPHCIDEQSSAPLFPVRLSRLGIPRSFHLPRDVRQHLVDIVISSGTFATRQVFALAGSMDADLFIDFVDVEWCLRCKRHNIPIYVISSIVMAHSIGKNTVKVGTLGVPVHNEIRCYYQLRNSLLLLRRPAVPLVYALYQILSVFTSRMLLLALVQARWSFCKAYGSAIVDGLRGIGGPKSVKRI